MIDILIRHKDETIIDLDRFKKELEIFLFNYLKKEETEIINELDLTFNDNNYE